MKIIISEEHAGKKLLNLLRGDLRFSRAAVTRLKQRENGIVLNGNPVTVRCVLAAGDRLELDICDRYEDENRSLLPVALPIEVLYEDEDLIAVNKPAGMPTHPTHGHYTDTLANALAARYLSRNRPFIFRAVNRLDKDTSGVVLVARNPVASNYLSCQIRERRIEKRYLAVCIGRLEQNSGRIESYIRRIDDSIIVRRNFETGRESEHAVTEYRCLFCTDRISVLEAMPLTGKTHQLRVHFSGIGHPICGDTLYGEENSFIKRQALHACSLRFQRPCDGAFIQIEAPLPRDIVQLIEEMK